MPLGRKVCRRKAVRDLSTKGSCSNAHTAPEDPRILFLPMGCFNMARLSLA